MKKSFSITYLVIKYVVQTVFYLLLVPFALILVLNWIPPPTTSYILRHRTVDKKTKYTWVNDDKISRYMKLAVVASEDTRFIEHSGFDMEAINSALENNKNGTVVRGASTITQQVAKNLFLWPEKSLVRKGIEAYLTVMLEICWSKKRILEVYINISEMGKGIYGVKEASLFYFNKEPMQLSKEECALLAIVLPSPRHISPLKKTPYVQERLNHVLGQMDYLELTGFFQQL
ncbi:monofunctional biosynthetic peptidoglycan transglycosylase [candidate division KSB1 bacterium]|nr:monofunctional biosynthetic peptidoglycan transglycosylase [candidate division KSB1 bacterium]